MEDSNGKVLEKGMTVSAKGCGSDTFEIIGFDVECGDVHILSNLVKLPIWRHFLNVTAI